MALQDYIPNIFGVTDPGVEGLLGVDQSKSLQSRSNIAGLLGAAAALSQGMSRGGPRRSALQNILGAAAGGYGAAGQQYQQGLQTVGQQQQLAQQMREREQAMITRQSIERVKKLPEFANNPAALAQLNADPINTLKFFNENMPISRAYEPMPAARPQIAPQQEMDSDPIGSVIQAAQGQQEPMLPAVAVDYTQSPLQAQKERLLIANQRLTGMPGKTAQEAIKNNIEQIAALDKQLIQESAANFDFNALKNNVSPDLAPQVDNLRRLAESGQFSMQDLQKGLQDIQKVDFDLKTKQRDYTNEVTRVAASMFPDQPLNTLSPAQLTALQNKLNAEEIAKAKAGATTVNVGAKKFSEEFGKGVAGAVDTTYQNALAAQNTISTIQTIKPLIQEGVYSGPLSTSRVFIDRLASSLGFASGTIEEKLARTAQSMQGLASLQLDGAKAMAGQGTITDFERGLIERASAGDFAKFTSKEVVALMGALEKVANKKIATHKTNLTRLRAREDTADLADFYELDAAPDSQSVRQYNPATGRIE